MREIKWSKHTGLAKSDPWMSSIHVLAQIGEFLKKDIFEISDDGSTEEEESETEGEVSELAQVKKTRADALLIQGEISSNGSLTVNEIIGRVFSEISIFQTWKETMTDAIKKHAEVYLEEIPPKQPWDEETEESILNKEVKKKCKSLRDKDVLFQERGQQALLRAILLVLRDAKDPDAKLEELLDRLEKAIEKNVFSRTHKTAIMKDILVDQSGKMITNVKNMNVAALTIEHLLRDTDKCQEILNKELEDLIDSDFSSKKTKKIEEVKKKL